MSPRVLLHAPPFGFGPVSKIATIGRALGARGVETTFVGEGVALEFAEREGMEPAISLSVYDDLGRQRLKRLALEFDYALTAMGHEFVDALPKSVPCGVVDSLTWMWSRKHFTENPSFGRATHYFIQSTFDARSKAALLPIEHPHFVGALLGDVPPYRRSSGTLVVHFGGVEDFFTPESEVVYPYHMLPALLDGPCAPGPRFERVVVATGARTAERLRTTCGRPGVEVVTLQHRAFLDLLAESELLLTAPGMTTTLEAWAIGVPTLFLPPQNYSQQLILSALQELGYPAPALDWTRFFPELRFDPADDEALQVRKIQALFGPFFDSPRVEQLQQILEGALDVPRATLASFARRVLADWGTHGVDQVCDIIVGGSSWRRVF